MNPISDPDNNEKLCDPGKDDLGSWGKFFLGGYMVLMAIGLFVLLVVLISVGPCGMGGSGAGCQELWLIELVLTAGALGSYIHAATSFADYSGNRRLVKSWLWWYILRTPVGMALAVILYFILRGGMLTGVQAETRLNPYGIAAISGLAGMFSKQATDKLKELFDSLFTSQGDAQRDDKLPPAAKS